MKLVASAGEISGFTLYANGVKGCSRVSSSKWGD
jgi:hypothetical protein